MHFSPRRAALLTLNNLEAVSRPHEKVKVGEGSSVRDDSSPLSGVDWLRSIEPGIFDVCSRLGSCELREGSIGEGLHRDSILFLAVHAELMVPLTDCWRIIISCGGSAVWATPSVVARCVATMLVIHLRANHRWSLEHEMSPSSCTAFDAAEDYFLSSAECSAASELWTSLSQRMASLNGISLDSAVPRHVLSCAVVEVLHAYEKDIVKFYEAYGPWTAAAAAPVDKESTLTGGSSSPSVTPSYVIALAHLLGHSRTSMDGPNGVPVIVQLRSLAQEVERLSLRSLRRMGSVGVMPYNYFLFLLAGVASILECCCHSSAAEELDALCPLSNYSEATQQARTAVIQCLKQLFGRCGDASHSARPEMGARVAQAFSDVAGESKQLWRQASADMETLLRRIFLYYATAGRRSSTSFDWGMGVQRGWQKFLSDLHVPSAETWLRAASAFIRDVPSPAVPRIPARCATGEWERECRDFFACVVQIHQQYAGAADAAPLGTGRQRLARPFCCIGIEHMKLSVVAVAAACGGYDAAHLAVADADKVTMWYLTNQRDPELLPYSVARAVHEGFTALPGRLHAAPPSFDVQLCSGARDADGMLVDIVSLSKGTANEDAIEMLYVAYAEQPGSSRNHDSSAVVFEPLSLLKILKKTGIVPDFLGIADVHRAVAASQIHGDNLARPCSEIRLPGTRYVSLVEFRMSLGLVAVTIAHTHFRGSLPDGVSLIVTRLALTDTATLRRSLKSHQLHQH